LSLTYFGNHHSASAPTGYVLDLDTSKHKYHLTLDEKYFTINDTSNLDKNDNYRVITGESRSVFIQTNFDNNERAPVQFDVKDVKYESDIYLSLQCEDIITGLTNTWTCGENESAYKQKEGHGYSR